MNSSRKPQKKRKSLLTEQNMILNVDVIKARASKTKIRHKSRQNDNKWNEQIKKDRKNITHAIIRSQTFVILKKFSQFFVTFYRKNALANFI